MKVIIPDNYSEYINTDVYVVRRTSNSLLILNSADKEIVDNNLKEQKHPFERFLMGNISKLYTADGVLVLPDELFINNNFSLRKESIGVLISQNE
jgi:hypothetical protein